MSGRLRTTMTPMISLEGSSPARTGAAYSAMRTPLGALRATKTMLRPWSACCT